VALLDSLSIAPWILFTVFAAAMQSVRTAGQKSLSNSITPMSATLVRYVFGLPFAVLWLWLLTGVDAVTLVVGSLSQPRFLLFATLAGVFQILATVLLIQSFRFQNFMVGTSFAKTESVQTAIFATLFFGLPLSLFGWVAVVLGVIGVWLMAMPDRSKPWDGKAILIGLGSGACFGFTSLWLREASLLLGHSVVVSAAITLVVIVALQSIICLLYTAIVSPVEFKRIGERLPLAFFVGATSAAGSIGWFTAMTWENPALVKSLGQIEMLFTAALTLRLFRERVRVLEWLGGFAVVASAVILVRIS